MLILTQRRDEIINVDYFDTLSVQHATLFPPESDETEVVAVKTNFETGDEEKITLGVYGDRASAEAVLANIAVDARDGNNAYIMEK